MRKTEYSLSTEGEEEEMSRRKRPMRRKRKVNNITEIESKPDSCQILEKIESSSFKLLGEGPFLNQLGVRKMLTLWMGPGQTETGNSLLLQKLCSIMM